MVGSPYKHIVLPHSSPSAVHRSFQLLNVVVTIFAGFALNMRPHAVVQRIEIWRLRGPEILGPESHVLAHPILDRFGCVRRCTILLKHVVSTFNNFSDPRKNFCGQDIPVIGACQPVTSLEPHWWHLFSIGCHNAKYHHRSRMLGCGDVTSVREILAKTYNSIILFVDEGSTVKVFSSEKMRTRLP